MKFLGRIRMPLGEIVTLENSILEKITARDINEKEKKENYSKATAVFRFNLLTRDSFKIESLSASTRNCTVGNLHGELHRLSLKSGIFNHFSRSTMFLPLALFNSNATEMRATARNRQIAFSRKLFFTECSPDASAFLGSSSDTSVRYTGSSCGRFSIYVFRIFRYTCAYVHGEKPERMGTVSVATRKYRRAGNFLSLSWNWKSCLC